jgi:hypothetical protein
MNSSLYYGLVKKLAGDYPHLLETGIAKIVDRIYQEYNYQEPHLYYHQTRIVIPATKKNEILQLAHNHPMSGHLGQTNTFVRLRQKYYWPGMYHDIIHYVQTCETCQKRNKDRHLFPISSATIIPKPFYHIGIDVLGPLPTTLQGNRYIILSVDLFSKWPEAHAVANADALNVCQFLYDDVICRHGVPQEITSDRGSEFCNELLATLYQTYQIKHIKTTAYHPQGNGQVERTNRTLKDILAKLTNEKDLPWDQYLHSALFALRTLRQESTHFSPFEILHGDTARLPFEELVKIPVDFESWENQIWQYIVSETERHHQIKEQARQFISRAQERQRSNVDKKIRKSPIPLHIGDKVLIYRNMIETTWAAKLEPKWEGPFHISDIKGTSAYLRKMDGSILPTPLHISRLKLYHDPLPSIFDHSSISPGPSRLSGTKAITITEHDDEA